MDLIKKNKPVILEANDEIERLAEIYVNKGVIPQKKKDDAEHIAFSTYYEMDVLLSWNYKHLANINKKMLIYSIHLGEGYNKPIEFITPMEVIDED